MRTAEEIKNENQRKADILYLTQGCIELWQTCKIKKLAAHAEEAWKAMEAAAILEWGAGTCCTLNADNADNGTVEIEHLDGRKKVFMLVEPKNGGPLGSTNAAK